MLRLLFILLFCSLCAQEVVVDLRDPLLKDGELITDQGGVVTAEGIRIQAQNIHYVDSTIEAEGNLMLEYGCDVFIGDKLEFNFETREGTLYCGRAAVGPWYMGGEKVNLLSDGTYVINNAYLTTCEDQNAEWQLRAKQVCVEPNGWAQARNVTFRLGQVPLMWFPYFRANTRDKIDIPVSLTAEYGGLMGSKVGLRYHFFERGAFKADARFDYFFSHGPGGGIETEYCPAGRPTDMFTQSYVARDRSVNDPKNRTRYRFAGRYQDCLMGWNTQVRYDKLSDLEMASDYKPNDFNLHTARWTEFKAYKQAPWWVANVQTRVRVNNFQSINQELPFLRFKLKPLSWGPTGIVSYSRVSAGYLDYVFAKETNMPGFNASRASVHQALYRPTHLGYLTITPGVDATGIVYSDSPQKNSQFLGTLDASIEAKTKLTRKWGCRKHVVEPYITYGYMAQPTSRIPKHYIFSINDGYTLQNISRVGIRNYLYKKEGSCLLQPLYLDLFAYAFYDTPTIKGTIPRLYADLTWSPTKYITTNLETAWNVSHHRIDHFNAQLKWTINEDLAFNVLYRYRSPYTWRKGDWSNFVLDSFRSEQSLLNSALSDRRYTIITRLFMRITPTLSAELETRHGFRRRNQPAYNEGKLSLNMLISGRWYLTVFVEKWEFKKKVANFGIKFNFGKGCRPCAPGNYPRDW